MLWRPLKGPLQLPRRLTDTARPGGGLALRGNKSPRAQASMHHGTGPGNSLGPSRVKVAPRCCWDFSENRQAGRRLLWEVALTQMLA